MRAAVMYGAGDVRLEEFEPPRILESADAIVRVTASCICGSDLHPYHRGLDGLASKQMGHEFVGVVEEVGADVTSLHPGDWVIAPFAISDGTCVNCRNGIQTSCLHGAFWGGVDYAGHDLGGGQSDRVRVPLADGTLVAVPGGIPDADLVPHLLALTDVMGTGLHAATAARVGAGSTVVVVGDGAVGLCGVLSARMLGAERIVMMSRHPVRQAVARAFGATDIVDSRGDDGVAAVRDLLDGIGADSVLECVGSAEAMVQATDSARPGGFVGFVGAPSGTLPTGTFFGRNLHYAGGVAPVRRYIPDLLERVLEGTLQPGAVFDAVMPLDEVAAGYAAMDERTAIKVMLRP